ncbi:hypothetical protein CLOM_g14657 [Closterium sp. NIES-68]|nr:hypothetical protein CLOM_g14657 [Closterium sp. NIES-68]GJP78187.1 hypothetical protein CLOP_g8518 [Closterium sp. NIES-67]
MSATYLHRGPVPVPAPRNAPPPPASEARASVVVAQISPRIVTLRFRRSQFLPVESRAQRKAAISSHSHPSVAAAPSAISGARCGSSATALRAADGDVAPTSTSTNGGSSGFDIRRVEQYTERVKGEVVVLNAVVDGEDDQVVVFRGFSSSLVLATPSDPSNPVLPASATITSVDRVRGPFNPVRMEYIQQDMRWEDFDQLLQAMHL